MTIDTRSLIERFGQAADRHVGVLFVGAGLSMQAGLPAWSELIAPLAAEVGAEHVADMPLVAEYYEQNAAGGRSALEHHLLQILSAVTAPSRSHTLITQLRVPEIWTTNFDTFLELADPSAHVISSESETTLIGTGQPVVVKMHGGFATAGATPVWQSPPVITRGDFERYEQERPRMWATLQASYLTRTLLFLGFSFDDPNVELLLRLARRQGTAVDNHHLAVLRRPTDAEQLKQHVLRVNDLEVNGIAVCEVSDFADREPLLLALQRRTRPNRLFVAGSGKDDAEHMWCDQVGVALAHHPDWQIASLAGDAGWWTTQRVAVQRKADDTYVAENLLLYFRRRSGASAPAMDDRVGTAIFTDLDRHPLIDEVVAQCRAMVVIGGGTRTNEEVTLARSEGVGVVPLAASGGAALEAWNAADAHDRILGGRPAPDRAWRQLNNADPAVAVQAVEQLVVQAMYANL